METQSNQHPLNFIFLSVIKDDKIIQTFDIDIEQLIYYQQYIESSFRNNTGGWTIRIAITI